VIIQALQPTDTGTLVATGAAAGDTGGTGVGANWRRTADAISRAASRYSLQSAVPRESCVLTVLFFDRVLDAMHALDAYS
jgi:hypothetical protein